MKRFSHAVFCWYLCGFDPAFYAWLLLLGHSVAAAGLMKILRDRQMVAKWLTDQFDPTADIDTIIHVLAGDAFFEQNKRDVAAVEKFAGRPIIQLWDTDPIFEKYPHLRGLARNKEFEEMMRKLKRAVRQR